MRGRKPRPGYPENPATIGEHLKRRRLDLGLRQRDVASEIGCSKASLLNWERGHAEPELRFLPAISRFLGYDPSPLPATLGERIRAVRRRQGISQRELARRLGLDPATVSTWETGAVVKPFPRIARLFKEFVEGV